MGGHPGLRKSLLKHKNFLAKLYKQKKGYANKRQIDKATTQERKVLLRTLFCICQGHIPIAKAHFHELVQSKRKPKLVAIGSDLKRLLKASEAEQKKCLKQFSSLYPLLLHPLFNA